MNYYIAYNYCKCHPETCCCNPYLVVNKNKERIATFFKKKDAENLISILNKEEK